MEQHELKCFSNTVEYHAFNLIATESAGFEKSFTDRLVEIAENVKAGTFLLAQYNAESLIGDYGTHVTNKALAGASIKMLSFTKADNETDKLSIKAKLTAGFKANILGIAKSDMEMHASLGLDFESQSYSSESQTFLITKGGPDVNKLFSQSPDGNKLSVDSVVGLTREGIPLFNLIHRGVLNGYDPKTMRMVQDLIYNATQEYYKHNTIPGCNDVHRNYFYKV
uniref:MACPF domain-containing protein n=1 Tax=Panagrolaimus davidi TaxID=227884 RepID=A0A914PC33_9BILA